MVTFKKKDYPLYLQPMDSILNPSLSILQRASSSVGTSYFGGYELSEEKKAGIVYKADGNSISWLKNFESDSAETTVTTMELTRQGIALVAREVAGDSIYSTFYQLDEAGNVEMQQRIDTELVARQILYNEEANRYVLVFRGREEDQEERGETQILALNGVGDVIWDERVTFVGFFKELIPTQGGFIMAATFSDYVDRRSNRIFNNGESNVLMLRLSDRGRLISDHPISTTGGISAVELVKVSDSNINILGNKGDSSDELNPNGMIHVIIDSFGRVIYSNLE